MLVFARLEGESVELDLPDGGTVKVQVVKVGQRPRIGFEAPQNVRIRRSEIPKAEFRKAVTP